MADIHQLLPRFDTAPFGHLLPALDRHGFNLCDLLAFDLNALHRPTQLPVAELRRLRDAVRKALLSDMGWGAEEETGPRQDDERETAVPDAAADDQRQPERGLGPGRLPSHPWTFITTLDRGLDDALGGGLPTGTVAEITGESATAKTLLLLHLLLSVQLSPPQGIAKSAIYISTEAPLPTTRLNQLLSTHPMLKDLPPGQQPTLSRILSVSARDPEAQDHYLRFQVPVAIRRHNVGLVVLDSVAANFRADFETHAAGHAASAAALSAPRGAALAKRSQMLVQLGSMLRGFARQGVAVVVANQVADRFSRANPSSLPPIGAAGPLTQRDSPPGAREWSAPEPLKPTIIEPQRPNHTKEPLTLDHQQRWFTGWGDDQHDTESIMKTPALGLVWANQVAARIALHREPVEMAQALVPVEEERIGQELDTDRQRWRRKARVVFAPWAPPSPPGGGVEFEVVSQGIKTIQH